ncbi:MAG TPA: hypothetical protein VMV17_05195 [Streptosporangiaceae bacterium]|nr:hypothetical protein [Terriglobales bacterium]HUZ35704.1 hypothetical protein [Streptosporangiaceae bacterium]
MTVVSVDSLRFEFPDGWAVAKYDDWQFCGEFQKLANGIKAADLIAVSPDGGTLYLIEAKDFSARLRVKTQPLMEELVWKTLCTLAALLPASLNQAGKASERQHAGLALRAKKVVVVFHIEPNLTAGLFPGPVYLAQIKMSLLGKFPRIDVPLHVTCKAAMPALGWSVS